MLNLKVAAMTSADDVISLYLASNILLMIITRGRATAFLALF